MNETRKEKLIEYLKKNISKGYNEEALKWALVNQGYSRTEILDAIKIVSDELKEKEKPIAKEKPKIKYQLYDKDNQLINLKKPFLKRFFG